MYTHCLSVIVLLLLCVLPAGARSDRYGDPLPADALARLGTVRLRHLYEVYSIAYSPDGKILASADNRRIRLWDATSGKLLREINRHKETVYALAFSTDAKWLASASGVISHSVRVWEVHSGKELHRLVGPYWGFADVAFSPDNKYLAAAGCDKCVWVWDAVTGKELCKLEGHAAAVKCVRFAADGTLASGDDAEGSTVRLWELPSGNLLHTITSPDECLGINSLAFVPDGQTLAFSTGFSYLELDSKAVNGSVHLWDLRRRKELRVIPVAKPRKVAFAADGKTLAVAAVGGAELWDTQSGKRLHRLGKKEGRDLLLAFSPDGRVLATAGDSGTIQLWDTASGKELLPVEGHHGIILSLAFSPDGKLLLSSCYWDGTVRLWDADSGKMLRQWQTTSIVTGVAFAPNSKDLAFGEENGPIHLTSVAPGATSSILEKSDWPTGSLAFSGDGKLLLSGSAIWDIRSGKQIRFLNEPWDGQVAFVLGGRVVARTHGFGGVSLIEAETGKKLRHFERFRFQHNLGCGKNVAFLPDGNQLAIHDHGTIRIFDLASAREQFSFQGGGWNIVWSADGKMLASTSLHPLDATMHASLHHEPPEIFLWETASGKMRRRWRGHWGPVAPLVFSRDGRKLATGSEDGTILIWHVAGPTKEKPPGLSAVELDKLWQALALDNTAAAFDAMRLLSANPEQAIPFMAEQLKSVSANVPADIARAVKDLASEQFVMRERAMRLLTQARQQAEPALVRARLQKLLTLEHRRRVEMLLDRLQALTGERLRTLRALEMLERMADGGALKLLERLADGADEALVTQQARGALHRLKK